VGKKETDEERSVKSRSIETFVGEKTHIKSLIKKVRTKNAKEKEREKKSEKGQ